MEAMSTCCGPDSIRVRATVMGGTRAEADSRNDRDREALTGLEQMARARGSVGVLGRDVRPDGCLRSVVDVGRVAGVLPGSAGRGARPGVVDGHRLRPAAGRGVSSLANGH